MSNFRCGSCSTNADSGVKTCTYTTKTWKFFYPNCKKTNLLCSTKGGAYVAAITVCSQSL